MDRFYAAHIKKLVYFLTSTWRRICSLHLDYRATLKNAFMTGLIRMYFEAWKEHRGNLCVKGIAVSARLLESVTTPLKDYVSVQYPQLEDDPEGYSDIKRECQCNLTNVLKSSGSCVKISNTRDSQGYRSSRYIEDDTTPLKLSIKVQYPCDESNNAVKVLPTYPRKVSNLKLEQWKAAPPSQISFPICSRSPSFQSLQARQRKPLESTVTPLRCSISEQYPE